MAFTVLVNAPTQPAAVHFFERAWKNKQLNPKKIMKTNRFTFLGLMAALLAFRSLAGTLPAGFYSADPMLPAHPDSTRSTPVNQAKLFTNGGSFGRTGPSIGGAGRPGLSLDVSGNDALHPALDLPANQSPFAQVLPFNASSTIDHFDYFSSSFNTLIFSSTPIIFSGGILITASSTPGLEWSDILAGENQGGSFDPDGAAAAPPDRQPPGFNGINNPIPEPGPVALVGMGLSILGLWHRFRTADG